MPLATVVALALGGNHIPVLIDQGVGVAAWNSLTTTFLSSFGAIVAGLVAAVVLDRTDVAGTRVLRMFVLSPLLIPPFVGAIAWLQLFGPNQGVNGWFDSPVWDIYGGDGVTFLMTVHSYPIAYLIISTALRSIPGDLELAARISGARAPTVITTVTLPLLSPAILSAFTLTAVSNLADFGIPSLLGSPRGFETLATMMYRFINTGTVDNPLQVTATIGVLLIILGVAAVVADHVMSARRPAAMQDTGSLSLIELGAARWPVTFAAWLLTLLITVAPILGLAYRALLPAPGVPLTWETMTLDNFTRALTNPRAVDGFTNSVVLSLGAAFLCGIIGLVAGVLITRTRHWSNGALTLLFLLPTALPGLLIGVGWLISGRYLGVYNSRWVILAAYVCAFTALVLQAVRAPLAQTPASVEEAARISGAGPLRALVDTTGRMAVPAAISGAVLVAVTAVRELTISVLLVAPGMTTLGVQVFNLQQAGNYNQASALSLLFAIVGIASLALTLSRSSPTRHRSQPHSHQQHGKV
ncbi:ABC transporter permease [Corynebacterium sp. LK2510]|uniref:ABC transporter permease n=1 Tax=Corynebacterium sp. LK2510 TaxID=3110472 RepID=UPI0034CF871F